MRDQKYIDNLEKQVLDFLAEVQVKVDSLMALRHPAVTAAQ